MSKKLFKLHSALALAALVPLLIICLTGSLLVFKSEIDGWLMPDKTVLNGASGARQPLDQLTAAIHRQLPGYEIGTWELFDDHQSADAVYLIKHGTFDWFKVFLDPYNGAVLSEPVPLTHYLTDWLVELHYTFLLGPGGIVVGFVGALVLLFLGISGLILYRGFWRRLFTLRWRAKITVVFSDLHKFTGVVASPVLLILGITGGYWNLAEFLHEAEEMQAAPFVMTQRMYSDQLSLDELSARAVERVHGLAPTYLVLAYEPDKAIIFYGRVPSGNPLLSNYASGVSFDPLTGAETLTWDIRELGFGAKLLDSFRHLHFGTFAGLPIRILWCAVGLAPLLLSFTGVYLWFNRRQKRRLSAANRQQLRQADSRA